VEKGTDRLVNPEGLIYRLIVRLHHQAMDRAQTPDGAHWRGGLVVRSRYSARALVTLTPEGVRVQVRGPDPFSYLHQVTDEIRECVDGFWEGLTTRALLPCVDPCGLGTPGRGLFDRDKLIEARERHRVDFPCGVSGCQEYPTIDTLLGAGAPQPPEQTNGPSSPEASRTSRHGSMNSPPLSPTTQSASLPSSMPSMTT
jgi:hypothetical protein